MGGTGLGVALVTSVASSMYSISDMGEEDQVLEAISSRTKALVNTLKKHTFMNAPRDRDVKNCEESDSSAN